MSNVFPSSKHILTMKELTNFASFNKQRKKLGGRVFLQSSKKYKYCFSQSEQQAKQIQKISDAVVESSKGTGVVVQRVLRRHGHILEQDFLTGKPIAFNPASFASKIASCILTRQELKSECLIISW
ncbi:MAG: hypothetical protein NTY48_01450 [Candidatus Diapherotrites archaeon]|nr:hypothetical protein [Candidatus Diapherotrites archaeon]